MLKINVIGSLRVARTYQGLLSNARGRSLTIGAPLHPSGNLVAYTAAKHGAEGAAAALRQELAAFGVDMVVLNFDNLPPDLMLAAPAIKKYVKYKICLFKFKYSYLLFQNVHAK